MPKKIWPREFRKPGDIVTCDCGDPNDIDRSIPVAFASGYGSDGIKAECLGCGTSEIYTVVEGDQLLGSYRAVLEFLHEQEEPTEEKATKPVNSRPAAKLSWGVFVPDYTRGERRPHEDRLTWFRRVLS
jgi:hypothetical protein